MKATCASIMNGLVNGRKNDMTQTQRVLQYMQENGSISQMEATNELSITRLASRIHDLIGMGYSINKKVEYGINIYGRYRYTRYSLEG